MSLRLRLLSMHVPRELLSMELDRVRTMTLEALDSIIEDHCPDMEVPGHPQVARDLEGQREEMAAMHRERVDLLADCLGVERAVELGRKRLFEVGVKLGKEARSRLGVGDSLKDTLRAARILYRVLGIEFTFEPVERGGTLSVHRCALSRRYSELTCRVMSATDEGVLRGLNPSLGLSFIRTIPGGARGCEAKILIGAER
jgi:hypothetical protein